MPPHSNPTLDRAQIAMTAMLSMLCAKPCPQAQITLPPFKNHLEPKGPVLFDRLRCRIGRIRGGPCATARCRCRAMLLGCAISDTPECVLRLRV